ncbi:hypothetical protein [Nonomuraea ceibae]|uniref:hypothetical protein n=1 Tax=Nonomuraea ceibae TaxID=1935170 RepID=UPI001C5F5EB1|nr:hypothetical protein [Nonomuraea ceibae]
MSQTPRDKAYDKAQARLTREAESRYQAPDWGSEDPRAREAYDRELSRTTPVGGQRGRR